MKYINSINNLFTNQKHNTMLLISLLFPLLVYSQTTTMEIENAPKRFTHSFGLQFNNCMYDKGNSMTKQKRDLNYILFVHTGVNFCLITI